MASERIVKILMKRDGVTKREAEKWITLTTAMMEDAIFAGNYDEAESILASELGLEMDYIFDILPII